MSAVDVIAVVGACAPERLRYARRLAAATRRELIPSSRLAGSPDPALEAAALASWSESPTGVVVEFPIEAPTTEIIGALVQDDARARLRAVVCVLDAAHLLDDLGRDDTVAYRRAPGGLPVDFLARAQLTVLQIEYASAVVMVNWGSLSTDTLSTVMALVNHLSPKARLRLQHSTVDIAEAVEPYSSSQERAGWVCVLNGEFDPHMTSPRVSALRYEQLRPFHPARLKHLLDERIEPGEFGRLVRSAGFSRLATRPHVVAQWEHVASMFSLSPLVGDDDDELASLGQELALIGLDLDHDGITAAFDAAALTDDELAAGPSAWRGFADPFPRWHMVADPTE